MSQLDPNAAQDTKFRTHRQKARFVQRFRHMRQSFAARRVVKGSSNGFKPSNNPDPVASLPSTYSVHEFHNYGFQGTGISPGLHFHLSGTINATTGEYNCQYTLTMYDFHDSTDIFGQIL